MSYIGSCRFVRAVALVIFVAGTSLSLVTAAEVAEPLSPEARALQQQLQQLRSRIIRRQAALSEIKQGLSLGKVGDTANILHALFAMGNSILVRRFLYALWREDKKSYPALPWARLESPIARVALASTLNRIAAGTVPEFLVYIRSQSNSEISLVKAQVAVALGFNGDEQDVDFLARSADGDNHYVAQSAITGLAFMHTAGAKDKLITLSAKYRNTPRGRLINEMLQTSYQWSPQQAAKTATKK